MTIFTEDGPIKLNFEAFDVGSAEYASMLYFFQLDFHYFVQHLFIHLFICLFIYILTLAGCLIYAETIQRLSTKLINW